MADPRWMKLLALRRRGPYARAAGGEVGFSLVRQSPVASWTRGTSDDPHWSHRAARPRRRLVRVRVGEVPTPAAMVWREAMDVIDERVAGLDVDKPMVVACVRRVSGHQFSRECRSFATTTVGLLALLAWLGGFVSRPERGPTGQACGLKAHGKNKSARLRKGACWLKTMLVQCAGAAKRKKGSSYQAQFFRLQSGRGPQKPSALSPPGSSPRSLTW